jgi:hypothetical protein
MTLRGTSAPLAVRLNGSPVAGGVAMSSGDVAFGSDNGSVVALNGTTIVARVDGAGGWMDLTLRLNLDQQNGSITGTASGTSGR